MLIGLSAALPNLVLFLCGLYRSPLLIASLGDYAGSPAQTLGMGGGFWQPSCIDAFAEVVDDHPSFLYVLAANAKTRLDTCKAAGI